jgi:hypothetical protein
MQPYRHIDDATRARRFPYVRVTISVCALALILLRGWLPKLLPTDPIGVTLLIIVVLPWILRSMPLSEIELLGVKLKLREVVDEQKQHGQTLAAHGQTIDKLVTYLMSSSIFRHLCGIGLLREYNYEDNDTNRRELYFLRDSGFIQPKAGAFLDFGQNTPRNLCAIATPTPVGWHFIKLRQHEIPDEWLTSQTKPNLAVDPSTL